MVRRLRYGTRRHARTRSSADQRTRAHQTLDRSRCSSKMPRANSAQSKARPSGSRVTTISTCWSEAKRVEKLRYIHRNPVHRGLVERPEDWLWSSFNHYATGVEGPVEIESQWTVRKREQSGVVPRIGPGSQKPHPVAKCATRMGHPHV